MHAAASILCVGELLWDSLPDGLYLGGAPFNVAAHLHALGIPVAMLSRVGRDRLGAEAVARVGRHGVPTELIQIDEHRPTGFVSVALDAEGAATYEILAPAAWDAIELVDTLVDLATKARAFVVGSLAQRSPASRETIQRLCGRATTRVFDVNLRPPHDDREVVRASLLCAEIVKLNEQELRRLGGWFGLPEGLERAARALAEEFGCETVCVTCGRGGAVLLREGRWSTHPGFTVDVIDTVGAGDAFLAEFLRGYLAGFDDAALLAHANRLGAFVASRAGAIPTLDRGAWEEWTAEVGPLRPPR